MMAKVFIGVGHGGSDPGAVANGWKEKDLNFSVALRCKDELERHGVSVRMSRYEDENDPLSERIKECNAFDPDLACDVHFNAGGGDGAEVYHSERDRSDDALAKNILAEITAVGQNSRGLKTKTRSDGSAYFGFIREIKCPAVLIECAFLDNAKDIAIADTEEKRGILGKAIAKGFLKTLGIAYKEAEKPTENKSGIGVGDLVSLSASATYYNGQRIPSWVKRNNWYVSSVKGDRAVLGRNQSGHNTVNSPVNTADLTVIQKSSERAETVENPLSVGAAVKLFACPLYASSTAKIAAGKKTGTFYVWSEIRRNGRIRITNSRANVGKAGQVTGWIDVTCVQKP